MVRRAVLRLDRPAEHQRHRDGLVVAVLRHGRKDDAQVALLHPGSGRMIPRLCRRLTTVPCPSWVKNESVVPDVRLPLHPRERTSWATAATSEKCNYRK